VDESRKTFPGTLIHIGESSRREPKKAEIDVHQMWAEKTERVSFCLTNSKNIGVCNDSKKEHWQRIGGVVDKMQR